MERCAWSRAIATWAEAVRATALARFAPAVAAAAVLLRSRSCGGCGDGAAQFGAISPAASAPPLASAARGDARRDGRAASADAPPSSVTRRAGAPAPPQGVSRAGTRGEADGGALMCSRRRGAPRSRRWWPPQPTEGAWERRWAEEAWGECQRMKPAGQPGSASPLMRLILPNPWITRVMCRGRPTF